jgi:hypothetical protein
MSDFSEHQQYEQTRPSAVLGPQYERTRLYSALGQRARDKAESTRGEVRENWLLIAQLWEQLADDGDIVTALPESPRPVRGLSLYY